MNTVTITMKTAIYIEILFAFKHDKPQW